MRIAFPCMKTNHGCVLGGFRWTCDVLITGRYQVWSCETLWVRVTALPRKELSVEVSKLGWINKALKTARDNAAAQLFHFIMDASRSRWRSARRSNTRLPVATSRSVRSSRCAHFGLGSINGKADLVTYEHLGRFNGHRFAGRASWRKSSI